MTDEQQTPEPGPLKVVDSSLLEEHTTMGWVLVESFDETDVEEHYGTEPQHVGEGSYGGTVSTTRHFQTSRRRFLLRYDRESTIAEQHREISDLRGKLTTIEANFEEHQKEHYKALTDLDHVEEKHKKAVDSFHAKCTELDGVKERLRAMETDMGKVRAAIGDIKFGEIVGAG